MERPPMEKALTTDIVMDIVMKYLKVRDLLSCRKVCKFWNKSASSVLRRRQTMMQNISEEEQLMQLEECMKQSWDFPFVGLKCNQPSNLNSSGALDFFENYGARFTRLCLGTSWESRLQVIASIINRLPCLSILETIWSYGEYPRAKILDSASGQEDGEMLKLSSLHTLRVSSELNEEVLHQVLTAASPSLRIEFLHPQFSVLEALSRLEKLQAVSVLTATEDWEYFTSGVAVANALSNASLTLTKLDLNIDGCLSREGLKNVLFSSQHTLKELRLVGKRPPEFSWEYPVFTKLTTLRLCLTDQPYYYFFLGRHGHKFPALKELELDVKSEYGRPSNANLTDNLFFVPSLTTIHLGGYVDKNNIERLAKSFPSVTVIRVDHGYSKGESQTGPFDIWSVGAFPCLEKLIIWDFPVEKPTKNYDVNMDSFLTGFPIAICENLRRHKQLDLTDCAFSKLVRGNRSILELTNLKELIVCLEPACSLKDLADDRPFMSMVSVWYALQMMPNLQVKFMRDCSLAWHDDEHDKAVLEAAFKQVQEYVKLEPFFY